MNPTGTNTATAAAINPVPRELWTVADVAAFMRVSRSWVYKNYRRHFTTYRAGRSLRFDPDEIRATIGNNKENPKQ